MLDELFAITDMDDDLGYPKDYCFVPWEREEDGTVEDLWALLEKTRKFHGPIGRGNQLPTHMVFIDRDSPNDKQLVFAHHRYVRIGGYAGDGNSCTSKWRFPKLKIRKHAIEPVPPRLSLADSLDTNSSAQA